MSTTGSRLRTVGIAVVALLILVAALSPTLLFGRGASAFGLILTAAVCSA